jgi:hypothetical protein
LKLKLLTSTPAVDTLIATAILTTTSGVSPSNLFHRLSANQAKVAETVGKLELQHGSILEHNRLDWLLEAEEGEVLKILLANRFFTVTRLGSDMWLVSANLRTVLEYQVEGDKFSELLLESIKDLVSSVYAFGRRKA